MGEMFLLVNFALIEIGFALENSPNRQPARSSVNGLNGAQRLNDWNDWNGPIPTLVPMPIGGRHLSTARHATAGLIARPVE